MKQCPHAPLPPPAEAVAPTTTIDRRAFLGALAGLAAPLAAEAQPAAKIAVPSAPAVAGI